MTTPAYYEWCSAVSCCKSLLTVVHANTRKLLGLVSVTTHRTFLLELPLASLPKLVAYYLIFSYTRWFLPPEHSHEQFARRTFPAAPAPFFFLSAYTFLPPFHCSFRTTTRGGTERHRARTPFIFAHSRACIVKEKNY